MKVAFVPQYGSPEVVQFRERDAPLPGPGQVRLQVFATTVSAGDWRIRSGVLPRGFGVLRGPALGFGGPRQAVLGTEAAGIIEAIGRRVTTLKIGDPVVAFPGGAMGAHAEFLIMPALGRLAPKPSQLSFEEAAALPFGGMTALDFLRRGAVQQGERILINGASGNVGSAMVQLAKHRGAHVTAVCSGANVELVRSLGADEVIDYTTSDWTTTGSYDVVADTVGNAPYSISKSSLASGGRLLAVLADLSETLGAAFAGRMSRHRVIAGPASEKVEDLHELCALAAQNVFKAVIDQRFAFEQIVDAYRVVDSGRKKGSVVLSLDPRSSSC